MHVIEQVAVEGPVADLVRGDVHREPFPRLHDDGVLARQVIALVVDHIEEHAVQVDRMGHHGVVHHRQAQPLVFVENDRLDDLGEAHTVE